ncbi:(Fe-S)-binding protein [Caloramator sp. CAR-1]|uniref:(Fe-S)-binding protein n=1 Tax=Caloramator sp. CAR-1 TaxID=3062777 RepID=UPI0026E413DF|nr:(Fe-S)-binding protein [Caloramator sp. CAR-1]MDO6354669.1 (Fe-S)-binding protein [Caloramator sp. CAR-1]
MKTNISTKIIQIAKKYHEVCKGCNICTNGCILLKDYVKHPKEFLKSLYEEKNIDNKLPYYCFSCNVCKNLCPNEVDFNKLFMEAKKEISRGKKSPHKKHFIIRNHQRLSSSKIFSTIKGKSAVGFMPGCSLSSFDPNLVIKIHDLLKIKYQNLSLILKCCGNPSYSIGEMERFNRMYNSLKSSLEENGIEHVITACQSCYKTMKENSPKLKVTSLWEELKSFNLPKLNTKDEFFIFDSCSADENIKKSIREIAKKLNIKIENNEVLTNSKCCGLGGCVHAINSDIFKSNLKEHEENIKSEKVLTYCAGCRDALSNVKDAFHILELIFNSDNLKPKAPTKTSKAWLNRLKLKAR